MIKNYNIVVNGENYEVSVEEIGLSASQRPVAAPVAAPTPRKATPAPKVAPAAPIAGGDSISAPMPGTIIDVKVKEGEAVKKGQVLCILEAMKMENEIMAMQDGTVASVRTSKGAAVSSGDILITLK